MKVIQGKHLGRFNLVGDVPEGTCPECATVHRDGQPHNQQSLSCQYKFYNEHGRWPTWRDTMAHCSETVKNLWKEALEERGIEV